jgi:hypothetical protein
VDGHFLGARPCDSTEEKACKLAEALLSEAGPVVGAIEVWRGGRLIRQITRKSG